MADANNAESIEEARAAELQRSRMRDKQRAREDVHGIAARIAARLNKRIAEGHDTSVLLIGLTLALFKDVVLDNALDFLGGIGEIPILGQLPGYLVSALLTYFIFGKNFVLRFFFMFFDVSPFFLNNLPMTTITVLLAWKEVRDRALQAESMLAELPGKTAEELTALEEEDEGAEQEEEA